MQQFIKHIRPWIDRFKQHPVRWGLVAGAVFTVAIGLPFFLPKTVQFSYADKTCARELTLLPGLHQQSTDSSYAVEFGESIEFAGLAIASQSICFTPVATPEPGDVKIATAPWGSWLIPQLYTLQVGSEPRVDAAAFAQPVPTTKPLSVSLDQPDSLHTYQLVVDKKSTECTDDGSTLSCGINDLELAQGRQYPYQLTRQFDNNPAEPVSDGTIKTLKAVKVTKSSIKNGRTIYSKPKAFSFQLDKPIEAADVSLTADKKRVDVDIVVDDKTINVKLAKQLDRQTKYNLVIDQVEATDGSTLVDPYKVNFTMSGGPQVTGISIGRGGVDANAQVVLTFDQELSAKQNVASLVSLKGGKGVTSKLNDRQVAVQLNSLGRCTPFTVSVAAGMLSKYDIKNDAGWSYGSRTICYTTSTYGTSLQGRPLVAYHFGNSGPVTLYTGAIHGNEVSSMYMMQSWIAELEANPRKIGDRQIVIIPNINPDGVAAGTRNNSRDVNLSRNFPTDNWERDIDDTDGPNKGGGGKKPLSEPEAAALAQFTQNLRPRLLLSYHAVGSLVVGDGHGTYSGGRAAQYASMVGYRNATGESGTFDYSITGAYEDWTWRNVGIPSMVIELGSYSYHSFDHHRAAMWAMLDE